VSKRIDISSQLDNEKVYAHYTMVLRDRHGNIIKKGRYEVHSAIRQYWQMVYNVASSSGSNNYLNILGNTESITNLQLRAGGSGNGTMGITVGTSSTAVSFNQTSLISRITNGTSPNQLGQAAMSVGYDPATGIATLSRTFINLNNTTDPTVNEVGMCLATSEATASGIVAIRDVPGSSYVVLFEAELTVTYEFQMPFGCQNLSMLLAKNLMARNNTNFELYNAAGTLVSSATVSTGAGAFGFVGGVGATARGIVVGEGDTATTFNTFEMEDQITHGGSSGELFHWDSSISSYEQETSTTNTGRFFLARAFTNKGGSSVTIKEVGLVSNATIGATNNTYLFERRVLGSPITVAPDETVTITWAYTYQFT
jgi:hypothetical protein